MSETDEDGPPPVQGVSEREVGDSKWGKKHEFKDYAFKEQDEQRRKFVLANKSLVEKPTDEVDTADSDEQPTTVQNVEPDSQTDAAEQTSGEVEEGVEQSSTQRTNDKTEAKREEDKRVAKEQVEVKRWIGEKVAEAEAPIGEIERTIREEETKRKAALDKELSWWDKRRGKEADYSNIDEVAAMARKLHIPDWDLAEMKLMQAKSADFNKKDADKKEGQSQPAAPTGVKASSPGSGSKDAGTGEKKDKEASSKKVYIKVDLDDDKEPVVSDVESDDKNDDEIAALRDNYGMLSDDALNAISENDQKAAAELQRRREKGGANVEASTEQSDQAPDVETDEVEDSSRVVEDTAPVEANVPKVEVVVEDDEISLAGKAEASVPKKEFPRTSDEEIASANMSKPYEFKDEDIKGGRKNQRVKRIGEKTFYLYDVGNTSKREEIKDSGQLKELLRAKIIVINIADAKEIVDKGNDFNIVDGDGKSNRRVKKLGDKYFYMYDEGRGSNKRGTVSKREEINSDQFEELLHQ